MSNRQEHIAEIEAYLSNSLEEEALKAFEDKLKADPALAKEVDFHKELAIGLADQETFDLETTLLEIREELEEEDEAADKVIPLYKRYWQMSVAAALLLLLAALFLLWPSQAPSPYAQFYEPYPNYLSTRSDNQEEALGQAIAQYQSGNYQNALSALQQLSTTDPDAPDLLFYTGICQLELSQTPSAIQAFQEVLLADENNYTTPAKWYLALAYVKNQETNKALPLLNDIIAQQDDFTQEAQNLLDIISE